MFFSVNKQFVGTFDDIIGNCWVKRITTWPTNKLSDILIKDKLTLKAVIALVFYTTVNVPKLEPAPNLEHQQIFVNEIK